MAMPLIFTTKAKAEENLLTFETMYNNANPIIHFSDLMKSYMGKEIVMRGFMAPPLKPEDDLVVLTKNPVAVCLFCSSVAEWERDIIVVYLKEIQDTVPNNKLIEIIGTLELGAWKDPETGFVSLVRVRDAYFTLVD